MVRQVGTADSHLLNLRSDSSTAHAERVKEILASWPVRKTTPPPPLLSRGQYCGLSINSDVMADEEFYLRYYVGHKGKFGHEFLEFEFRSDGRLRYANNSNYKNDTMIRKEGTRAARHPTPPYPTL